MDSSSVIKIADQFTRYPAGRYRTDGIFSGQRFREDLLVPALNQHGRVVLMLDGVMGYGSSFLEEVFGGLKRDEAYASADLLNMIELQSSDSSLVSEIKDYLSGTRH